MALLHFTPLPDKSRSVLDKGSAQALPLASSSGGVGVPPPQAPSLKKCRGRSNMNCNGLFQHICRQAQVEGKPIWLGQGVNYGLLLSRFSRVQLCATPQTATYQAPLSLRFSRQEHWSGLPFLLQCMKVKSGSEVAQSCPTLSDPMDCSLPGSSAHGIFQARVLEWGAINYAQLPLKTHFTTALLFLQF